MNEITISIIIPVYNTGEYLNSCLESIVKNDLGDKEIIIINDGSTDNSIDIINQYISKFNNIKVIHQKNQGNGVARNAGLRTAKGNYVAFIDSDDIINCNVLNNMHDHAIKTDADIVIADYYELYNDGKKKIRNDKSYMPEEVIDDFHTRLMKLFYIQISFSIWNKIYRREFLLENNLYFIEGYLFEDLDFVFKSIYHAKRISKLNEIFYGYRQRTGSIMKTITVKVLDKVWVADQLKKMLEDNNVYENYKEDFKFMYYKIIISVLYVSLKIVNPDKEENYKIINQIFENHYLKNDVLKKFTSFGKLSLKEKIIFVLMKYKIMNSFMCKLYIKVS